VLLRGLARESRHWGGFVPEFAQAFPGERVLVPDLPGNGRLWGERSPRSVAGMVDSVRDQLRSMGALGPVKTEAVGPVKVLAVSMGAMVACDWSRRYPHEVQVQVLINTSMRPFSPPWQRLRAASYPQLLRLLLAGASPEQWEQTILQITANGHHPQVLSSWLQYRRECPVSRLNLLRQLWAAATFKASRNASQMSGQRSAQMAAQMSTLAPTLVLASTQDRLVSVQCSRTLSKAWGVPLVEHAWAGHDLTLDDGPWVAQQVSQWMLGM
jgi:pimeloyl-ACP methyl ester carboxylesterase